MTLPFTVDQFMSVFKQYNLAVWPMQVVAYIMGTSILFLAVKKTKYSDKLIFAFLSFFWLWNGVVYHLMNFSSINKAAYIFGTLFVIQGIMFLALGVFSNKLAVQINPGIFSIIGSLFVTYAMIIYPVVGYFLGHGYPQSPSFGIAPCPTTIFTFGLLLWADKKLPLKVLWIPLAWSFIGFSAALSLGIWEDIGLLIAGVTGAALIVLKNKNNRFIINEANNLCAKNQIDK